ncbi:MAG: YeeE/YedE family protein [Marinilabiliales bacterium]|nr:YeeE/YedE family protein [Marinilabiliales bacterium]
MTGPLVASGLFSPAWDNLFAVLLGIGFGFALEASGFSSARKIIGTFFGYDFVVVKVFFTAAIVSSLGLLYMDYLGVVSFQALYIQPTFLASAIIGGIIMGIGFAMGGYCPGTSLCAVAVGRKDGLAFFGGMFIGIFLFSESFPLWEKLYYSGSMGSPLISDTLGISPEMFTFLLILIALAMFAGVSWIQNKVKKVEY